MNSPSSTRKHAPRKLGSSPTTVSPIALGCYSMSSTYGHRVDSESARVIHQAIDDGIDLFDTADFYGWGHNEQLLAAALGDRRKQVRISSKFGYVKGRDASIALDSTPQHVRAACEASLKRLRTDCIDLYFQHRLDPQVPIEDTVGAMAELVKAGKVRHLGLCEVSLSTLARAQAVHPIVAVQKEYSLWSREVEHELDQLDAMGTTLMAFSPLARGMLTGQIRSLDQLEASDTRRGFPRFSPENFPKNVALVDQLKPLAERHFCNVSQIALAWLLNRAERVVPICGADTLAFLADAVDALEVQLSPGEIAELDALFAPGRVAGDRYPAAIMAMLDR